MNGERGKKLLYRGPRCSCVIERTDWDELPRLPRSGLFLNVGFAATSRLAPPYYQVFFGSPGRKTGTLGQLPPRPIAGLPLNFGHDKGRYVRLSPAILD